MNPRRYCQKMNHKEFIDKLFKKKQIRNEIKRRQSKSHQISKYNIKKVSSPCSNGKMYTLDDEIKNLMLQTPFCFNQSIRLKTYRNYADKIFDKINSIPYFYVIKSH